MAKLFTLLALSCVLVLVSSQTDDVTTAQTTELTTFGEPPTYTTPANTVPQNNGEYKYAGYTVFQGADCLAGGWIIVKIGVCYFLRENVWFRTTYNATHILRDIYGTSDCSSESMSLLVFPKQVSCYSGSPVFLTSTFPFRTSSNVIVSFEDCGTGDYIPRVYPYQAALDTLTNCVDKQNSSMDYSTSQCRSNTRFYCGTNFPDDTPTLPTQNTQNPALTTSVTVTAEDGAAGTKTFDAPSGTNAGAPPKELNPDEAGTKLNGGTNPSIFVPSASEKGSGFVVTTFTTSRCGTVKPYGIKVRRSGTCLDNKSDGTSTRYIYVQGNVYGLVFSGSGCSSSNPDIYALRGCSITAAGYVAFSGSATFPSTLSTDGIAIQYNQEGCKGDKSWFIVPGAYSNGCTNPSGECTTNVLIGYYTKRCGGDYNPDSSGLSLVPTLLFAFAAIFLL